MTNKYPENVQNDVNNGFEVTDEDDGYQRVKKISETVFEFKCDDDGDEFEEVIDVEKIDKLKAISGRYDSLEEIEAEYGVNTNLVIAECEFENLCPARSN
jgi:hypothetical protein